MAGEFCQFPHRHPVGGIGQPAGIAERRLRQAEFAGALGHEVGGKDPLVAGHAFGERNAGIIAALDDRALQQVVHRHLAVENGKHGRAAGRRTALAPGVLADPVFVRRLYLAFLDGVEDDLDRHQLHHAGRRPQFVGALLEQHAAAGRFDQDRGRRVAVEAALLLLRRALHAVVGGVHDPAPTDREREDGGHQAAPRDDGRGVGFAGNGSLCCHRRCPESLRSNSWKYRKQHRFWTCLTCRRVDRIAAPDEGTYRGDAAISRQDTKNRAETRCHPHAPFPPTGWTSLLSSRARVRWCCSAMAGPNYPIPGGIRSEPSRKPVSMSSPPICAGSAGPARQPDVGAYTIFHNVGDMVALVAALGEKQAVIVGHDWGAPVAWHAAMFRPDVFTKVAGLSVPPPSRGRGLPLETLRQQRHHQFLLAVFSGAGRGRGRVRARCRRDDANRAGRTRVLRSGGPSICSGGQGLPRRCRSESAVAELADRGRHRLFRGDLPRVRLPRRAELVSQHRPQLGADRAVAGRANPPAVAVHRGIEGWRHYRADRRQAGQRDGACAAEFAAEAHSRWRRSLDPAGAARRGQRRPDRVPEGKAGAERSVQPAPAEDFAWARADRPAGKPGSEPHSWLHSRRTRRADFPRRGRASGWRPTFPRSH